MRKYEVIRPFKKRPEETYSQAVYHALEKAHHGDALFVDTYSHKTLASKVCRKYNVRPTERKQFGGGWLIFLNLHKVDDIDV